MVTSITQAFSTLKSNLEITDLQQSTVSDRQNNVRDVLKKNLDINDTFLTGSYSRNTLIAPLSEADVDIFVVLNSKYFHHYNGTNGGQAGLLDLIKRTLKVTFTRTPDISRNGQAVTIRFQDFMVDVVPAFYREGGGYLIPNSINQSWISTDPKKHVEIITHQNKLHNGQFIPLVKMIKGWNKSSNDSFFQSFHLEVLAMMIFQNVTISDFPSGMRFFFGKALDLIETTTPDPAGYGGNIGYYLDTDRKRNEASSKLLLAYERSLQAESCVYQQNNTFNAFQYWKKIFGDYFPSCG